MSKKPEQITCPNCKELKLSLIGILSFKRKSTKEFECSNCKQHFTE